jgi:hypothetical protein
MKRRYYVVMACVTIAVVIVGLLLVQYAQALREEQEQDRKDSVQAPEFFLVTAFTERASNMTYHFDVTIRNDGNEGGDAYFLCTLIYQNGDRESDSNHIYVQAGGERSMDVYVPYTDAVSRWVIETEVTLQ